MNSFYEHRSCSPLLAAKKNHWCDSRVPAAVLLDGDQPWLRRLLGISVAPQLGSIFNEAVRDNTAKQWNDIAARRTIQTDATKHPRYQVTGKSLDAAGCTGEPLLVIARNRVFLCILHCCMAFGGLPVAYLEARVGNHPREVAGEVQKIVYHNRCGMWLGAHNALDGEELHTLFWAWEQIAPLLAYVEEDPMWQAVVGLRTLLRTLYKQIPVVPRPLCDLLLLRFGNTAAGSRGRTICCSSERIVIQCLRVRMHAGWDCLPCRGTLLRAPITF